MTNYEWIMQQDEETLKICLAEGLALSDRKIVVCNDIGCCDCDFFKEYNCEKEKKKWLNEEHIENEKPVNPHWDVDTKVLVSSDGMNWKKRYFSIFCDTSEKPYACFFDGSTSWSAEGVTYWKYAKLAEE